MSPVHLHEALNYEFLFQFPKDELQHKCAGCGDVHWLLTPGLVFLRFRDGDYRGMCAPAFHIGVLKEEIQYLKSGT